MATKYVGLGLYIGEWQSHDGPEGNLKRDALDLMYGQDTQFATAKDDPSRFIGTFATYPEIAAIPSEPSA